MTEGGKHERERGEENEVEGTTERGKQWGEGEQRGGWGDNGRRVTTVRGGMEQQGGSNITGVKTTETTGRKRSVEGERNGRKKETTKENANGEKHKKL